MKQKRLIPILIIAIMLFNCFMPIVNVAATELSDNVRIQFNGELYNALKKGLTAENIIAIYNDQKRQITISEDEISKVTKLDLSEAAISDLAGLDTFANLTELDLSSNKLNKESSLEVLSGLNLTKLDLSTNNIEDVSSISNIDSIAEVNLHNQMLTQIEVISLDLSKKADNVCIVSKELPAIMLEAGEIKSEWLKEYHYDPDSALDFIWANFDNKQQAGVAKVDINVGTVDGDGNYIPHKGLLRLDIDVTDKTNPLSESKITVYYLVIDSSERASLFKDANLYNVVKKQLTKYDDNTKYGNDFNTDLRTYKEEGGETLYKKAYDDPQILVLDLNTLINEIPSLIVSNKQVVDLSGIETFVGLEEDLDLSYNYIDTIEKIIELQENKNIEEALLQERFKAQLSIISETRGKLIGFINQIETIDKTIEAIEATIAAAEKAITELNDPVTIAAQQLIILNETRKLTGYTDDKGNWVPGLEEQRVEVVVKADEQFVKLQGQLDALYEIYNNEYKATTILTLELNNLTVEQFNSLTFDEAKRLFNDQLSRIAALEANKGLSDIDLLGIQRLVIGFEVPTSDENGEIKNPVSTYLSNLAQENKDIWTASQYRNYIKKFMDLDVNLKLLNYIAIYLKYNPDTEVEEIEELYEEYIEEFIIDTEDKKIGESLNEIFDLDEVLEYVEIVNLPVYTIEPAETDDEVAVSYILGLSGKFVALTDEEIKAYITLPDLKKVNITNNLIESLDGLEILTELKELYAGENELITIDNVDWSKMPNMKILDLHFNFISDIQKLINLKKLKELNVSNNLLSGKFEFKLVALEKLEVADFSKNQYTDISDIISQYEFLVKDLGMTVRQYLALEDTVDIRFYNQKLSVDAGKILLKDGEAKVETIEIPKIFKQLEELEPEKTIFGYESIYGKVANDGTVGLMVSSQVGKHTGEVRVETKSGVDGIAMGHGTTCTIYYETAESKVNGVEFNKEENAEFKVELGKTIQFNAAVDAENVEDTSIIWTVSGATSSNTTIKNGLLTIGEDEVPGTIVTVIATSRYDASKSASVNVEVIKLKTTVAINAPVSELEQGKETTFTATVETEADEKGVVWTVENGIEGTTISEDGVLTVSADEVVGTELVIKATSKYDDTVFAEAKVNVLKYRENVTIVVDEVNEDKVYPGSTKAYVAKVTKDDGTEVTDAKVNWSVAGEKDKNSTKIENGLLTIGNEEINTKLLISASVEMDNNYNEAKSNTIEVTVVKYVVEKVEINEQAEEKGIKLGATKAYTATVTTDDAADKTVTWTVENAKSANTKFTDNILTIGADEVVGTKLTIKATSNYDNTVVASLEETVISNRVEISKPTKDDVVFEQVPGTTVANFVNGLVQGDYLVQVKDKAGNVLGNDVVLTTGMKLVVGDDEYTVVVKGDVNSDGVVDSLDSTSIKEYRLETRRLDEAAIEAADINKDGKVNRIDSFLILYYRAAKIENFSDEVINAIMK